MKVLVARNAPFEGLGLIASSLREFELGYADVDLFARVAPPPDLSVCAALIVLGGPMSANDDSPHIRGALRLIEEACSAGLPVLGVCLGAQLIARTLGAAVYRNPVKEIGWAPVSWTEAGRRDRLFHGLTSPEVVFHWHGETFDLPRGAELLAFSGACRHQAFRVGDNVHGLQFHLEVTPEMITDWLGQPANEADVRQLDSPIDPKANSVRLRELASIVFGRWCESVKSRG
jgi:GMP synthase-like glutamine amidotransferase